MRGLENIYVGTKFKKDGQMYEVFCVEIYNGCAGTIGAELCDKPKSGGYIDASDFVQLIANGKIEVTS